ncbi:Cytosolic carboxypeptidase 2, partial [Chelydra serpentina]
LTWTACFPHDHDTCYFAHFYPYTFSDLQRYLLAVASDPVRSQYCKLRVLCSSLAGNTVYLLTITSPSQNPAATAAKKAVVLSARVHPGETNGSWVMRGFLDFILSDSPDAQLLRKLFIFKVVPMLNPDGVIVGNYRCSLAGRDLNRSYRTVLKESFPCIWHTRSMIQRVLEEREVLLYCDFHGHSRKNNVFMYGCNNKSAPTKRLHERIFPLMLSKNAPDKVGVGAAHRKGRGSPLPFSTCMQPGGEALSQLLEPLTGHHGLGGGLGAAHRKGRGSPLPFSTCMQPGGEALSQLLEPLTGHHGLGGGLAISAYESQFAWSLLGAGEPAAHVPAVGGGGREREKSHHGARKALVLCSGPQQSCT